MPESGEISLSDPGEPLSQERSTPTDHTIRPGHPRYTEFLQLARSQRLKPGMTVRQGGLEYLVLLDNDLIFVPRGINSGAFDIAYNGRTTLPVRSKSVNIDDKGKV